MKLATVPRIGMAKTISANLLRVVSIFLPNRK